MAGLEVVCRGPQECDAERENANSGRSGHPIATLSLSKDSSGQPAEFAPDSGRFVDDELVTFAFYAATCGRGNTVRPCALGFVRISRTPPNDGPSIGHGCYCGDMVSLNGRSTVMETPA